MAKKSEYGKPTYTRAVLARVGIGDGYGNPKKVGTPYPPPKPKAERMNIANAPVTLPETIAKRKKMLDDL
jgi:hypothetical protein